MTREEAQQAWEKMRSEIDKENWLFVGTINPQMVDIAIEALQDRPKGHWKMFDIYDIKGRISGERAIICDRCLMKEIIRFGQSKWNFCPNCGADMRGEEE